MRRWWNVRLTAVAMAMAACGGPAAPEAGPLRGGVLATFTVGRETFRVWVRNPRTIADLLALQRGTSTASIPNGLLRAGAGQGSHNIPYSWHLDADEIQMAEATIEVCDGAPSYVQAHRDEFIAAVGRYCPWGARLAGVEDFR
jgi:hypothetical protein